MHVGMADELKEVHSQERTYVLEEVLGKGAFSVVYKAYEKGDKEWKAVKIGRKSPHNGYTNALCSEMEILQKLRHPCIANLLDHGIVDDQMFLVLEYGGTAAYQELQRPDSPLCASKQTRVRTAVQVTLDVLTALEYIHERGIIHNNVNSNNVVIREARGKLIDFNISTKVSRGKEGWYRLDIMDCNDVFWQLVGDGVLQHEFPFLKGIMESGSPKRFRHQLSVTNLKEAFQEALQTISRMSERSE